MGERVELGYLATPERGAGLGLVVLADDRGLCDRFGAEGFTALATDDVDRGVDWLLASDVVRGDGVGVLAFEVIDVHRADVHAVFVAEEMDDVTWTRALELYRSKLG
jgi:hypothetical protein